MLGATVVIMNDMDTKWLGLEPYEAEVSRTVLRGPGASNGRRLPGEIALAQRFEKAVSAEEFQVWKLRVNPDRSARLLCEDGNGHTVLEKAIEYTTFPAEGIELWFENSTIYLPSEH
jgi:Family of unknown function (DUF6876)